MSDVEHFLELGYAYSSEYQGEKDKEVLSFFKGFRSVEEKNKDRSQYIFKVFENRLEYYSTNGILIVNKVKCMGIVEINNDGTYNNSVFQILDRQAFYFKQDFECLTDLYNEFLKDVEKIKNDKGLNLKEMN